MWITFLLIEGILEINISTKKSIISDNYLQLNMVYVNINGPKKKVILSPYLPDLSNSDYFLAKL